MRWVNHHSRGLPSGTALAVRHDAENGLPIRVALQRCPVYVHHQIVCCIRRFQFAIPVDELIVLRSIDYLQWRYANDSFNVKSLLAVGT